MNLKTFSGGRGFLVSNFSGKLKNAGGSFRGHEDSILKVVKSRAGAIRTGQFNSQDAQRRFLALANKEKLSSETREKIKRLFNRLETRAVPPVSKLPEKKDITIKPEKTPPKVRINRDPNDQIRLQTGAVKVTDPIPPKKVNLSDSLNNF
jgi:hypothetical protein